MFGALSITASTKNKSLEFGLTSVIFQTGLHAGIVVQETRRIGSLPRECASSCAITINQNESVSR